MSRALEIKQFLYIDREQSILCVDQIRQYNLMRDDVELYHCKTTTTVSYVSTESHVVMCSDWEETGVVELLE